MDIFGEITFQRSRTDEKLGPLTKVTGVKKKHISILEAFLAKQKTWRP